MKFNPQTHHRRSIRLNGYDYARENLYFITICCQNKVCLFGEIQNGGMLLNDAGKNGDQTQGDLLFSKKMPEQKFGLFTVEVEATDILNNKKYIYTYK